MTTWLPLCAFCSKSRPDVFGSPIEAKETYMKATNKALFAPLLKPGDLDGGH